MKEMQDLRVQSLGWQVPLDRRMAPTPVFLPGKSHGQRCLADPSPWDLEESNTTEGLPLSLSDIDDTGSGSLLENQRHVCVLVSCLYEGDLL